MRQKEYDLTGPEGNAFAVIGFVCNTLKQLGKDPEYIKEENDEMISSDYDNLVAVAERELGNIVEFIHPDRDGYDNYDDEDY